MSHERYNPHRRRGGYGASGPSTVLGYWVPLAFTVTVATAGLAAWIWHERKEHDRKEDDRDKKGKGGPPPGSRPTEPGQATNARDEQHERVEEQSMMARMSGALKRTPSPQQIFDGASRRVAAGVAAAGAAVGGALASIREEDKRDYEDHTRWSEEAESRRAAKQPAASGAVPRTGQEIDAPQRQPPSIPKSADKRKSVAIVVSAAVVNHGHGEQETAYHQEEAVSRHCINPRTWALFAECRIVHVVSPSGTYRL
jgi:hypothetical protein